MGNIVVLFSDVIIGVVFFLLLVVCLIIELVILFGFFVGEGGGDG